MEDVTLICVTEAYRIGAWRDVLIGVWRGRPPRGAALGIESALVTIGRRWDRVSMLNIAEATAALPDADERSALLEVLRRRKDQIQCAALVLEVTGLKGAAVRAAVTSLSLLSRGGRPASTFASVEEAARWLTPHLAKAGAFEVSHYNIVNAVRSLRRQGAASGIARGPE